ncbi:hypothetical protein Avbf_07223 [Armadillidium vulgare]|nr:hypothetical protein Avbf_07223 [Armadillidium vulgare]
MFYLQQKISLYTFHIYILNCILRVPILLRGGESQFRHLGKICRFEKKTKFFSFVIKLLQQSKADPNCLGKQRKR